MLTIPQSVVTKTRDLYGEEGEKWLAQLPELVEQCAQRWSLTIEAPYASLSYNLALRARGADGTLLALKLGFPAPELISEIEALGLYAGRGCVLLLDAVPEDGALLLERLTPGTMLVSLEEDDEATRIAVGVMQALWRPLPDVHSFPTVTKWAAGMQRLRVAFDGGCGPFPQRLVEAAESLFGELLASASAPVLLHGDLHHYNILAAQRVAWLAIDPKGVSGEPLYETGAWLRNPMPQVATWSSLQTILARRAAILAEMLDADIRRILGWGAAQAVLSSWWNYEEDGAPGVEALYLAEIMLALYEAHGA